MASRALDPPTIASSGFSGGSRLSRVVCHVTYVNGSLLELSQYSSGTTVHAPLVMKHWRPSKATPASSAAATSTSGLRCRNPAENPLMPPSLLIKRKEHRVARVVR